MTSTLRGLPVQRVAGFFGAHVAASAAHEPRFGFSPPPQAGLSLLAVAVRRSASDMASERFPQTGSGRPCVPITPRMSLRSERFALNS